MKILFVIHQYFPRHVGGTEIYTRALVRRALNAGHSVEIVSCHENSSNKKSETIVESFEYEGVAVREIQNNLSLSENPALNEYLNPRLGSEFGLLLDRFKPDLLHFMHAMKLSASTLQECHARNIPFILTLCDFWFICPNHSLIDWQGQLCSGPDKQDKCMPCIKHLHGAQAITWEQDKACAATNARKSLLQGLALNADRIFALSEFQKQIFVQNGYPENRIEVLTHGLELDDLKSADNAATPAKTANLRIGFIGQLVPHKGVHVLLEALSHLKSTPLECHIYGPLRQNPYVKKLAAAALEHPGTRLFGELPSQRLGEVMAGFDVLVLPALWYENQPLVIKAALHLGIPVIASDIGSLSEMLQGKENCWLLEPGNSNELAGLIEKLVKDPPRRGQPQAVKNMDTHSAELFKEYAITLAQRAGAGVKS